MLSRSAGFAAANLARSTVAPAVSVQGVAVREMSIIGRGNVVEERKKREGDGKSKRSAIIFEGV